MEDTLVATFSCKVPATLPSYMVGRMRRSPNYRTNYTLTAKDPEQPFLHLEDHLLTGILRLEVYEVQVWGSIGLGQPILDLEAHLLIGDLQSANIQGSGLGVYTRLGQLILDMEVHLWEPADCRHLEGSWTRAQGELRGKLEQSKARARGELGGVRGS